ncbi:MAG: hypothetical protein WBW88_14090, partial [Rhodothermales bacterium]
MPRIRCTQRLLKVLGKEAARSARDDDSEASDLDWDADLFSIESRKCLIFVNAGTRLPVVAFDASTDDFRDPAALLRERYEEVLRYLEAPFDEIEREMSLFAELPIGSTRDRGAVGLMSELVGFTKNTVEFAGGLVEVTDWEVSAGLAKIPTGRIGTGHPEHALRKRIPGLGRGRRQAAERHPERDVGPSGGSRKVLTDFLSHPDRGGAASTYQEVLGFLFHMVAAPRPIRPSK